ncbi:hypothetical protein Ancab_007217 [Ancistrocladus abbreviatus]
MRTVSGTIVSSKPVSLSKAAKILSEFASFDNGASPAFAAYLKRSSASFNELVHLHKELKGSGSERKGKRKYHSQDEVHNVVEAIEEGENGQGGEDSKIKKLNAEEDGRGSDAIPRIQGDGKKRHKKKRDEDENEASKGSMVSVGNGGKTYVAKDGSDRKKHEKESVSCDAIVGIANGEMKYDVTSTKVGEIKDEQGGKQRIRKTKKKNRDESEEGRSGGVKDFEVNEQRYDKGGATEREGDRDGMSNKGSEGKTHRKKNKGNELKNREDWVMQGAKVRVQSYIVDVEGGNGQRHKKNQDDKIEERESVNKAETVESEEKESKKRKNKELVNGGLDDSEEQYKTKKKKRKTEAYD